MDIIVSNRIVQKPNVSVIGDNADYTANFHFDSEWDGIVKTARFEQKNGGFADVVLVNDSCEIPVQVLKRGYLKIGVYSEKMTTTATEIYVNESIKERGGIPKQPAYDVYAQILEKIDKLKGSGVDKETLKEIVSEETRKYIAENGIEIDTTEVNGMVESYIEEHREELKGADGAPGRDGADGTNGKSAYDLWLESGNTGSVSDFLQSLKGEKGDPGEGGTGGAVTDEQVKEAVDNYFAENPIDSTGLNIVNNTTYENEDEASIWVYRAGTEEEEELSCTNIEFMMNSISFTELGATEILEASLTPSNTTDTLSWSSSDESIATVTAISGTTNATVKAIAEGTATITATCGNITQICTITVTVENSGGTDDGGNTGGSGTETDSEQWYQITTDILPNIVGYTPAVDYSELASHCTEPDYWENASAYSSANSSYRQAIIMRATKFYNTTSLKPFTSNTNFTDTFICGRGTAKPSDTWAANDTNKQTITFKGKCELFNYKTGTYEDITTLCADYKIDAPSEV